MINVYKTKQARQFLNEKVEQPNLNLYNVVFPRHIIIYGGTGGGKTNCFVNLLNYYKMDDLLQNVILCCKTPDEELYKMLRTVLKDKLQIINGLNELPPFEENKVIGKTILIFDDCVADKDQTKIEKYFLAGRKKNIQCIYLSQSYFKIPQFIRKQVEGGGYVFLLGKIGKTNLLNIAKNCGFDKEDFDLFNKVFKNATKEDLCALKIDIKARDYNKKLARNFIDYYYIYDDDSDEFLNSNEVELYNGGGLLN